MGSERCWVGLGGASVYVNCHIHMYINLYVCNNKMCKCAQTFTHIGNMGTGWVGCHFGSDCSFLWFFSSYGCLAALDSCAVSWSITGKTGDTSSKCPCTCDHIITQLHSRVNAPAFNNDICLHSCLLEDMSNLKFTGLKLSQPGLAKLN